MAQVDVTKAWFTIEAGELVEKDYLERIKQGYIKVYLVLPEPDADATEFDRELHNITVEKYGNADLIVNAEYVGGERMTLETKSDEGHSGHLGVRKSHKLYVFYVQR